MTVSAECGEAWDALVELELKRLGGEGWEVFHVTERKTALVSTVHLKAYLKRRTFACDIIAYNGSVTTIKQDCEATRNAMQSSIASQIEGGVHQRVD